MKIGQVALGVGSICSVINKAGALPTPQEESSVNPNVSPIGEEPKYFHEAGEKDTLGHYDQRFFKRIDSDEDRRSTLQHLMRAYLKFFRERNIETWIAHGTLLGWWWNEKLLPWDWDIDVQVSDSTLEYLANHLNGTKYHYVSEDRSMERDYLLDVNPFWTKRDRGEGLNIIDARWIDIRTGLYVDITGLSQNRPKHPQEIWMCKNLHEYRTEDLFPMQESMFEGVPTKVPYSYEKILSEEYERKALTNTEYEEHRWDPQKKEWVNKAEKPHLITQDETPHPHVPISVQPRSTAPGLQNLGRLFQES
ncbi:MAG: hypothetical protein M1816_003129 [Peltula sp. TS41687]|nr:MAG: hypothetical protein M1816_003129 [Peltula sp. TS41687]